ncbi:unnamed protein product, partial [Iphiclides podalirius]
MCALLVISLTVYTLQYQIPSNINGVVGDNNWDLMVRQKRQLENFDTDETSQDEEEPGFWDKEMEILQILL